METGIGARTRASGGGDRRALADDLRRAVKGEVRFDTATRAMYATDASNYRQPPIGVVVPKSVDDVIASVRVCRDHGAPILSRGCGTSLSGETVNEAVVIDHSKYLREIVELDVERRLVTVQSGAVNEQVNRFVGDRAGLVFPPDPSTHEYCTIGGNVGNNSCGVHSVQAQLFGHGPRTSDHVAALDVLTYDGLRLTVADRYEPEELDRIVAAGGRRGEIFRDLVSLRDRYESQIRERFPSLDRLPRRVSGYNLDDLLPERGFNLASALCGTEGTCVSVLHVTLKLIPQDAHRTLLVVGFEDICEAADHAPEILEHRPIALEGIDRALFEDEAQEGMYPEQLSQLPDGHAWLLIEFGAPSKREGDERARELVERLRRTRKRPTGCSIVDDPEQERALWKVREAGLGATAFPPDGRDHWPGWEDSAVPPERVGDYIRDLKRLYARHGYRGAFYGHLGQGCVHSRISFDLRSAAGVERFRRFMEEAADLVVSYGGSLSGEHGDGQARAELLEKQFGVDLVGAFREFKRIWDPEWKMNPGKVVDPYRLDENLKLGAGYNPWRPSTKFAYPEDGGDFAHAALRCVGAGKCRAPEGAGVMCPSFVATKEEMHTTRGRARLLYEMLEGDIVQDGWRSTEVRDALDLCLACKGCTNDCPVHVDMPRYKSEFWSHHYAGRLRPRQAYAFGLVDRVAALGSRMPAVANALTRTPPLAGLAKLAAGMAPQREIPTFAPQTLQDWFARRGGTQTREGPLVVLWPDTFNNRFHTDVGVACVEALEAAGWRVVLPRGHVCCGRPLYDYGFLDLAKRYLLRSVDVVRAHVRAGVPVVGMEPSCVAVFKDELTKLLPYDDDAARLAQNTFHLGEFLHRFDAPLPSLTGEALLWGHCHQKATGGLTADRQLLERMGLDVEEVGGGCCGLAGSWGFESAHYELSLRCGEQALLPRVRAAGPETAIVANGFSCKTQIEHGTERRALHLAQVLALARERGGGVAAMPERSCVGERPAPPGRRGRAAVAAALGLAGVLGAMALAAGRN